MRRSFLFILVVLTATLQAMRAEAQNAQPAAGQKLTKQELKERESMDMVRLLDKAAGLDTLYMGVRLQVKNLYTDSLQIGVNFFDDHAQTEWYEARQIDYFRHRSEYYEKRTLVENDGREHYIHLKRDKGSKRKRTMVYSFGKGAQAQYYVRYKESPRLTPMASADGHFSDFTRHYLDNLWHKPTAQASGYVAEAKPSRHNFRLAELIYRRHNDHYLTHFRWGVAAGLNYTMARGTTGDFDPQLCATGGLWADLPIDYTGFSLRIEACYAALSGHCQARSSEAVYNYKGLELPFLVRYTALPLRSRILPYVEAGMALDLPLSHNLRLETAHFDGQRTFYRQWVGEPVDQRALTNLFGAGVEYILSPRHSVWAGLRYRMDSRLDDFRALSLESSDTGDSHFVVDRHGLMFTLMFNL